MQAYSERMAPVTSLVDLSTRANAKMSEEERQELKDLLSDAITHRKDELASVRKRLGETIIVDFSTLREWMSRQGISLEAIKCPSCGGTVQLPLAGARMSCEYCGSCIYAMQVASRGAR